MSPGGGGNGGPPDLMMTSSGGPINLVNSAVGVRASVGCVIDGWSLPEQAAAPGTLRVVMQQLGVAEAPRSIVEEVHVVLLLLLSLPLLLLLRPVPRGLDKAPGRAQALAIAGVVHAHGGVEPVREVRSGGGRRLRERCRRRARSSSSTASARLHIGRQEAGGGGGKPPQLDAPSSGGRRS